MSEARIMRKIQMLASQLGSRLFRNNSGVFKTLDGRAIRTGLCTGSSDLIGWTPLVITPLMLGRTVAIFTAVEVKSDTGRVSPEQLSFIDTVLAAGGFASVVHSEEEFKGCLDGFKS